MAIINDQTTGTPARVSALGSLLVTYGDDGYPTYFTKLYHPRLTTSLAVGSVLWAMRAPATRTLSIIGGQLILTIDTSVAGGGVTSVDLARFTTADPVSGNTLVPAKKRTQDPDPNTTAIKTATATASVGASGMAIDSTSTSYLHVNVANIAGSQTVVDLDGWAGLELGPGDGLALVARPSAPPIGFNIGGWLQFSEIG